MKCVKPELGMIEALSVQRAGELALLVETIKDLGGKPFDSIVHTIAQKISDLLHYPYCSILLACSEKDTLLIEGAHGLSSRYIDLVNQRYVIPRGNGPSGLAYSKGWSFAVDDVFKDPDFVKWRDVAAEAGYSSVISVPISTTMKKIGSLTCYTSCKHIFSEQEMLWLSAVGKATGSAIQIASFISSKDEAISKLVETNTLMKKQEEVSSSFIKRVLGGESSKGILDYLAELLQKQVMLEDERLRVVYSVEPRSITYGRGNAVKSTKELLSRRETSSLFNEVHKNLTPIEIPPLKDWGIEQARIILPIAIGQDILGYLTIIGQDSRIQGIDMKIAEYGAAALAFSLIKQHSVAKYGSRRKAHFIDTLIMNKELSDDEILEQSLEFGGKALVPYRAIIIEVRQSEPSINVSRILSRLADAITANNPDCLSKKTHKHLQVLFPENDGDDKNTTAINAVNKLEYTLKGLEESAYLIAAIGSRKERLIEFRESFWEAERLLGLLSVPDRLSMGHSKIICGLYDRLSIAGLLLKSNNPKQLYEFAEKTLNPIAEYDTRYNSDLLLTLRTYIQADCHRQKCASVLNIHHNTLAYRLQKIGQICGKSVTRLDDLMEIRLSMEIIDLFKDQKE